MSDTRHTMSVYPDHAQGCWVVRDTDPVVQELFGTDTLPTPFTVKCPVAVVLAELRERNPDKNVVEPN